MTQTPPLRGDVSEWHDGRYRVWTVAECPWGTYPDYSDGGPARVSVNGWHVSATTGFPDGSAVLTLVKDTTGPVSTWVRHPLDKTTFPNLREAWQAAYEAGGLGYMVYEKDAGRWTA